jgi:DNA mismatch repair ATPase MutS
MSGKSTCLRSMGLGAVLGLAGGPVCATRLKLAPVQVATSMRISDSLAGGVSHFYAELRKLKSVLDSTTQALPVFFLLDEILHGTNSKERQIGARYVLSELLRAGALGAVSTHDYALCELQGELAQHVTLVHFREDVTQDEMTFDYKVRPGPVTEGNALRLMRGLGIEVPLG